MKKLLTISMFLLCFATAIAETVYITETGKRYHAKESCSGLSNAKRTIPIEKDKAAKKGYTPCKKEY